MGEVSGRDTKYGQSLLVHELMHACAGPHDDRFGRPDPRGLAMEFMINCGGGWRGSRRGPILKKLPPDYEVKPHLYVLGPITGENDFA